MEAILTTGLRLICGEGAAGAIPPIPIALAGARDRSTQRPRINGPPSVIQMHEDVARE
jgi:hypothetical protein